MKIEADELIERIDENIKKYEAHHLVHHRIDDFLKCAELNFKISELIKTKILIKQLENES